MLQMRHDIKGPVVHFAEYLKSDITLICHRVVSEPTDVHKKRFSICATEFQILAFAYIFVEDQATSLSCYNRSLCHRLEIKSAVISTVDHEAHSHRNPLGSAFWRLFGRFEHSRKNS